MLGEAAQSRRRDSSAVERSPARPGRRGGPPPFASLKDRLQEPRQRGLPLALPFFHHPARAWHLVSYLGLAPRVRASGGHLRTGSLTKEGPPLVRSYLVQAVQNAIRSPGPCQDLYLQVRERSGSQAARVAIARKLAITAYLAWKFPGEVSSRG